MLTFKLPDPLPSSYGVQQQKSKLTISFTFGVYKHLQSIPNSITKGATIVHAWDEPHFCGGSTHRDGLLFLWAGKILRGGICFRQRWVFPLVNQVLFEHRTQISSGLKLWTRCWTTWSTTRSTTSTTRGSTSLTRTRWLTLILGTLS